MEFKHKSVLLSEAYGVTEHPTGRYLRGWHIGLAADILMRSAAGFRTKAALSGSNPDEAAIEAARVRLRGV